ncbi:hypothetical protein WJ438_40245 [Streptomyces sp. GD-15H]|uniref:hypothetical protein n=1 Tax=Streptomyces sp. GD-15H TaxID=3129112 RepID=UPI003244382B
MIPIGNTTTWRFVKNISAKPATTVSGTTPAVIDPDQGQHHLGSLTHQHRSNTDKLPQIIISAAARASGDDMPGAGFDAPAGASNPAPGGMGAPRPVTYCRLGRDCSYATSLSDMSHADGACG